MPDFGGGVSVLIRIAGDVAGVMNGLEQVEGGLDRVRQAGDALKSVGSSLTTMVTMPLVGAATAAVAMGEGMDQAMRGITDVTGKVGPELDSLRGTFIGMSRDITVTTESADKLAGGYASLWQMGIKGADTLDVLKQATHFATAENTDLDKVIRLVASGMQVYGMTVQDVGGFQDVLAKTMDISKVSFDELSAGMSQVLPVAKETGVGVNDIAAAVATMTQRGQDAGTSFAGVQRLLVGLQTPGKELAAVMQAVGYESGETALKQDGLGGVLGKLNGYLVEHDQGWQTIFPDLRTYRSVAALAGDGAVGFTQNLNELNGAMQGAGETQDDYTLATQGMGAQLASLKNDVVGVAVQLGEVLLPYVHDGIEFVKGLANRFGELDEGTAKIIVTVGLLAAGIGPALMIIGTLIGAIASPIGLIVLAVAGLAAAWETNFGGMQDVLQDVWDTVEPLFSGIVDAVELIIDEWDTFAGVGDALRYIAWEDIVPEWLADTIYGIADAFDDLQEIMGMILEGGWEDIRWDAVLPDWVVDAAGGIYDAFEELVGFVTDSLPKAQETATTVFDAVLTVAQPIVDVLPGIIEEGVNAVTSFFEENLPIARETASEVFGGVLDLVNEILPDVADTVRTQTDDWIQWWNENLPGIKEDVGPIWDDVKGIFQDKLKDIGDFFQTEVGVILDWWNENLPLINQTATTVMDFLRGIIMGVLNAIGDFWRAHGQDVLAIVNALWDTLKLVIDTALKIILGIIKALMQIINGDWSGAWQTIKDTAGQVWENLKGIFENGKTILLSVFNVLVDGLKNVWRVTWNEIKTQVPEHLAAIKASIEGFKDRLVEAGKNLIQGLMNGITSMAQAVINAAKEVVQGAINAAKNLLGIHSRSQVFYDVGESSMLGLQMGIAQNQDLPTGALTDVLLAMIRILAEGGKQWEKYADSAGNLGDFADAIQEMITAFGMLTAIDPGTINVAALVSVTNNLFDTMQVFWARFEDISDDIRSKVLKQAEHFADTMQVGLEMMAQALDVFAQLGDYASPADAKIQAAMSDIQRVWAWMFYYFMDEIMWLSDGMKERISMFFDLVKQIVGTLGDAIDTMVALRDYVSPGAEAIVALVTDLATAWTQAAAAFAVGVAATTEDLAAQAQAFWSQLSEMSKALKSGVDVMGSLVGYVSPTIPQIFAFVLDFARLWGGVADVFSGAVAGSTVEISKQGEEFWKEVSSFAKAMQDGVEVMMALVEYVSPTAAVIDSFAADFVRLWTQVIANLGIVFIFQSADLSDQGEAFWKALGSFADAMKKGVDTMLALVAYVSPSTAQIDDFAADFVQLWARVVANLGVVFVLQDTDLSKQAVEFWKALASFADAMKKGVEVMSGLMAYVGPTAAQINSFASDFVLLWTRVVANLGIVFIFQSADLSKQSEAFWKAMQAMASALQNGLKLMADLVGYVSPSSEAIEAFTTGLILVLTKAAAALGKLAVSVDATLIKPWADLSSNLFKGLAAGADVLVKVGQLTMPTEDAINTFVFTVAGMLSSASYAIAIWLADVDVKLVSPWADLSQKLLKGLSEGVDLLNEINTVVIPDLNVLNDFVVMVLSVVSYAGYLLSQVDAVVDVEIVKPWAEIIGKLLSGLEDGIDLLNGLNTIILPDLNVLNDFVVIVLGVVSYAGELLQQVSQVVDATLIKPWADLMGNLFKGLTAGVDLLAGISTVVIPDLNILNDFVVIVVGVVSYAGDLLQQVSEAVDVELVKPWADIVGKLLKGLTDGIDLLNGITTLVMPERNAVSMFVGQVMQVVDQAANEIAGWPDRVDTEIVVPWTKVVGDLLKGLAAGVGLLTGLVTYIAPTHASVTAFFAGVSGVLAYMIEWVGTAPAGVAEILGPWADTLGKLFKSLKEGVEGFTALRDYQGVPVEMIQLFVGDIETAMGILGEAAARLNATAVQVAAELMGYLDDIFKSLKTGVDALSKLRDYQGVPVAVMQLFLSDMGTFGTLLSTVTILYQTEVLSSALGVSAAISLIVSTIKDALGRIKDLTDIGEGATGSVGVLGQIADGLNGLAGRFADTENLIGRLGFNGAYQFMQNIARGLRAGLSLVEAEIAALAALFPQSPAERGPLAKPIDWAWLSRGLPEALDTVNAMLAGPSLSPAPISLSGSGGAFTQVNVSGQFVIREDADVDRIAEAIYRRFRSQTGEKML